MLYAIADAGCPVRYISCGNLVSENRFLHMNRLMDSYVFIAVQEGLLHIRTGEASYTAGPGEFLFLFPGLLHCGARPSEGRLSYYWTHFYMTDPNAAVTDYPEGQIPALSGAPAALREHFILPEKGTLSDSHRTLLLFVQLLDISRRNGFSAGPQCDYALSTLLLELTGGFLRKYDIRQRHTDLPSGIADMIEWIQLHYDSDLTAAGIAARFGYHPSYLAAVFKKHTGCSVIEYINRRRIRAACNLLTAPPKQSVAKISEMAGFRDEKYFMRLFRRYEGMTPTQYRDAFSRKPLNKN